MAEQTKPLMDMDVHTACDNGDGTYDGVTLAQWMVECVSGKPLSREDATQLVRDAQQRARERLYASQRQQNQNKA